jgi:GNAT superfamily N-acetyltransferase
MEIKLITAPAKEYVDKLTHFLEHKGRPSMRDIKQRLRGDYAEYCVDKYIVGEIDGQVAGQIWYGYGKTGTGIANFGHVYTEPAHRKKGVVDQLMKFFLADFQASPVRAALCGTDTPWVADIYLRHGFQQIMKGSRQIGLVLFNQGKDRNFDELQKTYFKPDETVEVDYGGIAQRHDVDTFFSRSLVMLDMDKPRFAMANAVVSYIDAIHRMEDGHGVITVAATPLRHVVGWAFFLNTGSHLEAEAKVFDFEIHPWFAKFAQSVVGKSLQLAAKRGIRQAFAYCDGNDKEKVELLKSVGFAEAARLDDFLGVGHATRALVILRGGKWMPDEALNVPDDA